ncbi:MAG: hypothetical protein NZ903_00630 [Candidatus Micrarchaeota archaeon]|nr:hypothetical protein [Candidatus Micrarchaeota archaeon]
MRQIFIFLMILPIFFALSDISKEEISFNAKVFTNIINVELKENVNFILPAQEYKFAVNISWNIDNEYLRNINSKNVTIFVKAFANDSFIYFKDGEIR